MTAQNPELSPENTPKTTTSLWTWVRRSLYVFIALIVLLLATILGLAHSDKGSQFLLEFVMDRQNFATYRYEHGNLIDGVAVKDIVVKVKTVEVKVDHADVLLGWRSILDKQIHLKRAHVGVVTVINHAPPSNKDFQFPRVNLPFVLYLEQIKLNQLVIQAQTSKVTFNDIVADQAEWKGSKIHVTNGQMDMGFLNAKQVVGYIQLDEKYPLNVRGNLNIPALNHLKIQDIYIDARGSLDTLKVGVATATPDLIAGHIIAHPVRKKLPMQAKLSWKEIRWPFLAEQDFFSDQGQVEAKGNLNRLNINLDTDFKGKNVPVGHYQAKLNTDLKQLNIESFNSSILNNDIELHGWLNWQNGISWDVRGASKGIQAQDLPEVVQQFIPFGELNHFSSQGDLDQKIEAQVGFASKENWQAVLTPHQAKQQKNWHVAVNWQNINRELPYIGWLKSAKGDVDVILADQGQDIAFVTQLDSHEKSLLPQGQYTGALKFKDQKLQVNQFTLEQSGVTTLAAQATVDLPREKSPLQWQVDVKTQQFDPTQIVKSLPFTQMTGVVSAQGRIQAGTNHIIQLKNIDLQNFVGAKKTSMHLKGASNIAVFLHDGKEQKGLKSYAVKYKGQLGYENILGPLDIDISGTPSFLNIKKFEHVDKNVFAKVQGQLNFAKGFMWNLTGELSQFQPQYFGVPYAVGNISGSLKTDGQWSAVKKQINLHNLDVSGDLNGLPLKGKGNLKVDLSPTATLDYKSVSAQGDLDFEYAKTTAIKVKGNINNNLEVGVKIPNLAVFNPFLKTQSNKQPELKGELNGDFVVQLQPYLNIKFLNQDGMKLKAFSYRTSSPNQPKAQPLVTLSELILKGNLSFSEQISALTLESKGLKLGANPVPNLKLAVKGKQSGHVVKIDLGEAQKDSVLFNFKLAGGFNANKDWFGQIQQLSLSAQKNRKSKKAEMRLHAPANLILRDFSNLQLNKSCFDLLSSEANMTQSKQLGEVCLSVVKDQLNLNLKETELDHISPLLPPNFHLKGKIGGAAVVSWQGKKIQELKANFKSSNGEIRLEGESQSLKYKEMLFALTNIGDDNYKILFDIPDSDFGKIRMQSELNATTKALDANISINKLNLKLFRPFIADVRTLEGDLNFAATLGGKFTEKDGFETTKLDGRFVLNQGAFALNSVPLDLKNINLTTRLFRDQDSPIQGEFRSGGGKGIITGNILNLSNEKTRAIKLKITGKNLDILQPPLVTAKVSPALNLEIEPANKKLTVGGEINIPEAQIYMPEASPSVVGLSPDVRLASKEVQDAIAAAQPWNIIADITVHLNRNLGDEKDNESGKVEFRGFNSKLPLAGRLRLTQTGREFALRANGTLGVGKTPQVIEAYGQRINLNRAIARFSGELANPNLDIEASKTVQNTLIRLQVTNELANPKVQILTDSGLSEQEAINAFLTGRISSGASGMNNSEGFKSDVNNTIAAAGISMGLGGTRAFTNQLGRTFGLSDLALDAQGAGDDTQVSVTGYITPDLYLRYGVGIFTPVNKLTLRYQMNRRLYIEATSSVERAVDIFYHWRF